MYPLRLRPSVARYRGVSALQNPSGVVIGLVGLLAVGGGAAWYFLAGPGLSDADKHKKMTLDQQVDNPLKIYSDGRREIITKAEGDRLVATGTWHHGDALRRSVVEGAAVTSGTTAKGMRFGKGAISSSKKRPDVVGLIKTGADVLKTVKDATA